MSFVPRLAKVVNVLAVRQVKQETETTRFRIGFTLHSCQYLSSCFNNHTFYNLHYIIIYILLNHW